jgi:AhpD family alkylhydroperoxidase
MDKKVKLFQDAEKSGMFVVGQRNQPVFAAFLSLAHEVMHPQSAFDQVTRELLGAYVSKQFGCSFCHLGHLETAAALGGETAKDQVNQPTEELQILFDLADKITSNQITEEDVAHFLAKGYSEKHYEDVVFVCALFGFANRMVTAFGIEYNDKRDAASSRYLAKGYKLNT